MSCLYVVETLWQIGKVRGSSLDREPNSESSSARALQTGLGILLGYTFSVCAVSGVFLFLSREPLAGFRIDALYAILGLHLPGSFILAGLLWSTRRQARYRIWCGRLLLAVTPFLAVASCDRLALLSFPPAPLRDPTAALFQQHPTRKWTFRPNAEAPFLHVKLNDRGMRGPILPYVKPPGESRIVILGDSVAFGEGVSDERCFDRLTENLLKERGQGAWRFVNLSVMGYAPWQEIDLLRSEGLMYGPDLVVYAFCVNDVLGWIWRDVPTRDPLPFRHELLERSGLLRFARGAVHALRRWSVLRSFDVDRYSMERVLADSDSPEINEAWNTMLRDVRQIVDQARQSGAKVAFLLFPTERQLNAGSARQPQRRLREFAEINGVPYLDLQQAFTDSSDSSGQYAGGLFLDGWHLSAKGHTITADAFVEFLCANDLVNPKEP